MEYQGTYPFFSNPQGFRHRNASHYSQIEAEDHLNHARDAGQKQNEAEAEAEAEEIEEDEAEDEENEAEDEENEAEDEENEAEDEVEEEEEATHFPEAAHFPNPPCPSRQGNISNLQAPPPPSDIALPGRTHRDDWSDLATQALLHSWGSKFLQLGRKNLKLEDWTYVAHQVEIVGHTRKTDVQCRNRIHALKKKFKREKQKLVALGHSDWMHYQHMDELLNPVLPPQQTAMPSPVVASERIDNLNPQGHTRKHDRHTARRVSPFSRLHVSHDDPKSSENSLNLSDDDSRAETKRSERNSRKRKSRHDPFRNLAKAIKKFGRIYEKIETTKQQQLLDLEITRMQLTREFELRKMQLLMHTQIELAKLKQGGKDTHVSASDASGINHDF